MSICEGAITGVNLPAERHGAMNRIAAEKFKQWTENKTGAEARMTVYEMIRDIPYAVVPDLVSPLRYEEILTLGTGSCTPKHFLLCDMYQRLGMTVLYAGYPFRWDEFDVDYPARLRKLAEGMQVSYHLACKVEIDGDLVLVDATLDPKLEVLGLPVNREWNGRSDTLLPVKPCGGEEIYHPCETPYMRFRDDEASLAFYRELNRWLERAREHKG